MFYPDDARIPESLQTEEFLIRPLKATDVALDYDAVISSRAELFLGSGTTWPREGFTIEENLEDLEEHEREFYERVSFTYTVMNPEETECLGCIYIDPLEAFLGDDAGSDAYLTDCTAYVTYWVRQSRLADTLDKRLLQALIPWFQNEWTFSHVLFVAQRVQQRQIQLFEEEGMQLLYTLKPRRPFLDLDLVYTFDQNLARTAKNR
jgi:hypothetical protein